MFEFLKRLRERKSPEVTRTPVAGEIWYLSDGSPWLKMNCPAEILEVRDGWVRYKLSDLIYQDERLRVESFVRCYSYVSQDEYTS